MAGRDLTGQTFGELRVIKPTGSRKYNGYYVSGNVVPCCRACNCAKLAMPREEFLDWIERVYNYSCKNRDKL